MDLTADIRSLLLERGPLIGRDLVAATGAEGFEVWKQCAGSSGFARRTVGRRYLRLDSRVDGFARLSPSILREFLSYTVVGLPEQPDDMARIAARLAAAIAEISRDKLNLAKEAMRDCLRSTALDDRFDKGACAFIAGDIVFGMSHREPRPEFSTGKVVRGSDLDIVVIVDSLPAGDVASLDSALYQKKFELLTSPLYFEEIDYLIKDIAKVESQLRFNDFKAMVACKILHEGEYLRGSERLFRHVKARLAECGIPDRLATLERMAEAHRKAAEIRLLGNPGLLSENEMHQLFFTTAEHEEFY